MAALIPVISAQAQSPPTNTVRVIEPVEGRTSLPAVDHTTSRLTVTHYDGLGRTKAVVDVAAARGETDLVTMVGYDSCGQVWRQWLPAPVDDCGGSLATLPDAAAYYGDAYPYSEHIYDGTDRCLPSVETLPGEAWNIGGGHSWRYERTFNREWGEGISTEWGETLPLHCIAYEIDSDGHLTTDGTCRPGSTLKVAVATDPDGRIRASFTDSRGRMLLERRTDRAVCDMADTYYVYDMADRLCFVVTPKAAAMLESDPKSLSKAQSLCFSYSYDGRDRLIAKTVPGGATSEYVYDRLNRLIFSRDSQQSLSGEWNAPKYDPQMRVALKGRAVMPAATRESLQRQWADSLLVERHDSSAPMETALQYTTRCALPGFIADRAFYYDDYSHWNSLPPIETTAGVHVIACTAQGLPTGEAVTDFSGTVTVSAVHYDGHGNTVYRAERDLFGQSASVAETTTYDFGNHPVGRHSIACTLSEATVTGRFVEDCEYDRDTRGRLTAVRHRVNGGAWTTLASHQLDDLGRIWRTAYGNSTAPAVTRTYDLHGWPTAITSQHYSEALHYADTDAQPCYGGKISAIDESGAAALGNRTLDYGTFGQLLQSSGDRSVLREEMDYDLNGNVTAILRGLPGARTDSLILSYEGNTLTTVTQHAGPYVGTVPHIAFTGSSAVSHDAAGRLTADASRGITRIAYNPLGLPSMIWLGDSDRIAIDYRADGVKTGSSTMHTYTTLVRRTDSKTGQVTMKPVKKS